MWLRVNQRLGGFSYRNGSVLILSCCDSSLSVAASLCCVILLSRVVDYLTTLTIIAYEWLLRVLFVKFWDIQVHSIVLSSLGWVRYLNSVHFIRMAADATWRLSVSPANVLGAVSKLTALFWSHDLMSDVLCGSFTSQINRIVSFLASCRIFLAWGYNLSVICCTHLSHLRAASVFIEVKSCVMEL